MPLAESLDVNFGVPANKLVISACPLILVSNATKSNESIFVISSSKLILTSEFNFNWVSPPGIFLPLTSASNKIGFTNRTPPLSSYDSVPLN